LKSTIFFFLSLLILKTQGQNPNYKIYDPNDLSYSKTDFTIVDSLKYWHYQLSFSVDNESKDSTKPIGRISFWRTKPFTSPSQEVSENRWRPFIEFEIYALKDSIYCKKKSIQARIYSSCIAPQVGGDLFIISNYIFLNTQGCVNCLRESTNIDACRPTLNYLFTWVNPSHVKTIEDITKQFPISKGSRMEF
jgi:hypothetical protein